MRKKLLFALLSLLLLPLGVVAQNVTISPNSGSLVASIGDNGQTGGSLGLSALWRHEQLQLSLTAADRDGLFDNGEISFPSPVLGVRNEKLVLLGGHRPTYLVVSLPKGYRITGYRLVLQNDLQGANLGGSFTSVNTNQDGTGGRDNGTMRFFECKPWKTNTTNSRVDNNPDEGFNGSNQYPGYNATYVRYIEPGAWVRDGGVIGTPASDIITWAKRTENNQTITDIKTGDNKEFTIERHSMTENDMSNQLYFRLVKNFSYYGLTIKSFDIDFTAEGTFNDTIRAAGTDIARSYVRAPFETSKTDIGKMERRTQVGTNYTYFSYDYEQVRSLKGYTSIYQWNSVLDDGTPADMQNNKHIYTVNTGDETLFAFGTDTFYVEPPTNIHTSSGLDVPIGYRIVGAKFEYKYGTRVVGEEHTVTGAIRIYVTRNGTNYYLTPSGQGVRFVTVNNQQNAQTWHLDADSLIYIGDGENRQYLACQGDDDEFRTLSFSQLPYNKWNLRRDKNGRIYYKDSQDRYYYLVRPDGNGTAIQNANPTVVVDPTGELATSQQSETMQVKYPDFEPGTYTLKVYDKTGKKIATGKDGTTGETVNGQFTVTSNDDAGVFLLDSLNNDAVKFSIDVAEGKQALVKVTLQMQALDPYINSMNIVCTDVPRELQMIQTFTANDFRVSGGEFIFYVPAKYRGQPMNLEFSNLRSDYADQTYPTGSNMHFSRYSFVTSEYFYPINGNGNYGLYDTAYSPDASYTNKIIANTAGNIRFKFNNAEDIGTGSTGSAYLIEYPFSVQTYLGSADPDKNSNGTPTGKTGTFIPCQVTAGDGTQEFGTFYLFTADETRYNIAPSKAWQHRSYAFYRMDVKVVAKDYDPVLAWTPIYNTTLYGDDKKTESQWGLTVTTKEKGTETVVKGYLTYEDIIDQLEGCDAEYYEQDEADAWNARLVGAVKEGDSVPADYQTKVGSPAAGTTLTATEAKAYNAKLTGAVSGGSLKKAAVTKKLGDNSAAPKTTEQILYIDGSNLLYILEDNNMDETTLKNKIGRNAFIFLPVNVTSEADNVAFKTESGSFKAARNVVLIDKQPFFTPYDIQVNAANYATYSREITVPKNGKVVNASVMLPFTLRLNNSGVHTNPTGNTIPGSGLKFTVNILGSETVDIEKDATSEYGPYDHGIVYFKPYIDPVAVENTTLANRSYMIKVADGDAPEGDISFIATQTGALIEETPHQTVADAYTHTGELIPGDDCDKVMTFGDEDLEFKNYGTYSGTLFSRNNNNIFYFANNQYLSMTELVPSMKLNMFPFRGVFAYTVKEPSPSRKYSLKNFEVSYDEPSLGNTTSINDISKKADLMIRTDKGSMTISSTKEQVVTIYSANGICVAKANMQGGDTQTINLPSGVYVVNNVKIAVK